MTNPTIVAISTPIGIGGISIVRLSGSSAIAIADEFFCAKNKTQLKNAQHALMNFGEFDLDGVIEKGYAVVFFAPKSFTGETVVEMHVHGGNLIAQKIVEKCVASGAKVAGKGDFSKRAFINGKASLDSLEGMIDMIHAESEAELRAASGLYGGKLKTQVDSAYDSLLEAVSGIDVAIDYPDEVDEEPTKEDVFEKIQSAKSTLQNLLAFKKQGKILRDGVMTLILGKPNVGKSSVLNAILGEDRAIVTDTPGTTRDIVRESFVFEDTKFQILDTAGIRDTSDKIESIGIEKAKENVSRADLCLFVVDASREIGREDNEIFELVKNKNTILVLNKTDKQKTKSATEFFEHFNGEKIQISAEKNVGIGNLLKRMKERSGVVSTEGTILLNERHIETIETALNELGKANREDSLDVLSFKIKTCVFELGKIGGKTASEDVVSKIFSKFCVGK